MWSRTSVSGYSEEEDEEEPLIRINKQQLINKNLEQKKM